MWRITIQGKSSFHSFLSATTRKLQQICFQQMSFVDQQQHRLYFISLNVFLLMYIMFWLDVSAFWIGYLGEKNQLMDLDNHHFES